MTSFSFPVFSFSLSSFRRCSHFSLYASLEVVIAYELTIIFLLEYSHFLMAVALCALRRRIALTEWVDGAD
jgi:hypothetical protein